MRCLILALYLNWTSNALAAEECHEHADLSKDLGPVWNQANTSWCHAFTASDLLTQILLKHQILEPGERLHPLRVASTIPIKIGSSPNLEMQLAGTPLTDITSLNEEGAPRGLLCKETDLDGRTDEANQLFRESWNSARPLIQEYDEKAEAIRGCDLGSYPKSLKDLRNMIAAQESKVWNEAFKNNCRVKLPLFYWAYWWSDRRFREIQSGGPLTVNPVFEKEIDEKIEKALDRNQIVAIGYDVSFLKVKRGVPQSHWSSIVGESRGPDNKCYYLIRNSWGADCKWYSPSVHCSNGYLRVEKSKLLHRIHTLQYIDTVLPKNWNSRGN